MKKSQRLQSLLLAAVLLLGLLPASALGANTTPRVHVTVQGHYPYWEANSLQAMSEHLSDPKTRGGLLRVLQQLLLQGKLEFGLSCFHRRILSAC